jgi:Ca2+/Na+ antiporter
MHRRALLYCITYLIVVYRQHQNEIMSTPASDTSSQPSSSPSKKTQYASYKLLIASNLFFVLGSTLYLAAALVNAQENAKPVSQQKGVLLNWVFLTGGALSFVVVGTLDCRNTQRRMRLHMVLILAGMFGTASAATSQGPDITVSLLCNLIATHLFLLESLQWIYGHVRGTQLVDEDARKMSLACAEFGDFCFFLGALMDVGLAYFFWMQKETTWIATQSLETSQAEIVSAIFWFLSSVVTILISCRLGKRGFADGVVVGTPSGDSGNFA